MPWRFGWPWCTPARVWLRSATRHRLSRIWACLSFPVILQTLRQVASMQVCCCRGWNLAYALNGRVAPFSVRVRKGSCNRAAAAAEQTHVAIGATYIARGQLYYPLHAYPRVPGLGPATCVCRDLYRIVFGNWSSSSLHYAADGTSIMAALKSRQQSETGYVCHGQWLRTLYCTFVYCGTTERHSCWYG